MMFKTHLYFERSAMRNHPLSPKGGSEKRIRPTSHLNIICFSDPPFWIPLWGTVSQSAIGGWRASSAVRFQGKGSRAREVFFTDTGVAQVLHQVVLTGGFYAISPTIISTNPCFAWLCLINRTILREGCSTGERGCSCLIQCGFLKFWLLILNIIPRYKCRPPRLRHRQGCT